jgi:hypothetical protein
VFCKPCNICPLRLSHPPWILKQLVSAKRWYLSNKQQDSCKRTPVLRDRHILMIPKVACGFSSITETCLEAYRFELQTEELPVKITDCKFLLQSYSYGFSSGNITWNANIETTSNLSIFNLQDLDDFIFYLFIFFVSVQLNTRLLIISHKYRFSVSSDGVRSVMTPSCCFISKGLTSWQAF